MPEAVYDIAIVGGGLAGLTLAIQCADEGYKAIVFEKEQYPFHRVCGEYISMESWNFLERCGLPLNAWALPQIHRLQVSDSQGRIFDFPLAMGGFGVSRYKLDDALYGLAVRKGVRVCTGCKVNDVHFHDELFLVRHTQGGCRAKLVAGSFGKRSNLDLKWNRAFILKHAGRLDNYIGVKYHVQYPQLPDTISLHNFRNGYCGISRIEDGKCCLCYLTTAQNLRDSGNSIRHMEREVLSRNPALRKIFSAAKFLYDEPLTISQVSFAPKKQVEEHVLMLGDAAGMITPLCGNGMSMAMHAAKLAFEQVKHFLAGEISRQEMENAYEANWKKIFGRRLQTGRTVQSFFGGYLATSLFLRVMHAVPFLGRTVIHKTHGQPF